MTTAREDVAAWLTQNTTLRTVATIDAIANTRSPVVLVARSAINPSPIPDTRDDELTVWLITPELDLAAAEASLDANVDQITDALDRHEFLHWSSGERDMFGGEGGYHAFRITVTHRTVIEPPIGG